MKSLSVALWTESAKALKSRTLFLTLVFFMIIPLMLGLMMFISGHPEISGKLGLVGTKAAFFSKSNWGTYFLMLNQSAATIGILGFGFVFSWIFGREYADRTMKDLLALPVSRTSLVLAKIVIASLWCIMLAIILLVSGLAVGALLQMPGWSPAIARDNLFRFLMIESLTLIVSLPVAFFASYGRGYLLPMGFVIITLIIAQFSGLVGLGKFIPWAVPGMFSFPGQLHPPAVSFCILILTGLAGILVTIAWWKRADQF